MIRLLCRGEYLDLYESENFQFTKTNPLFAFDELCAERTTQFKLPSTPKNDAVFKLSRIPAYSGAGMRERYECQLQEGCLSRKGYLYVSEYDGKDYKCIMLCGMLFDIKAFGAHEWGTLRFNKLHLRADAINANSPDVKIIDIPRYHIEGAAFSTPSIDVGALLHMLNDQGVLPISGMDDDIKLRYIRKDGALLREQDHLEDVAETLVNEDATEHAMGVSTTEDVIYAEQSAIRTWLEDNPEPDINYMPGFQSGVGTITFPEDTPQNLCLCCVGEPSIEDEDHRGYYYAIRFVGGRGFRRPATQEGSVEYYGEPLAGRTIELGENDASGFILLTGASLRYDETLGRDLFSFNELDYSQEPDYSVDIRFTGHHIGETLVNYMLNDLNLGQLLHIYSAISGKLIGAKANGEYLFVDSLNLNNVEPDIMSIKSVERKFGNYAQHNYIKFAEDAENMLPGEATHVDYTIDNVNLDYEKDLDKLEAAEGGIYMDVNYDDDENIENNLIEVRGVEYNAELVGHELPNDTVAEINEDFTHMQRANLRKCELLQDLCDESTQIKIECHMSLFQYDKIDSDTAMLVHGTRYIWIDSTWQAEKATFTLAKLP